MARASPRRICLKALRQVRDGPLNDDLHHARGSSADHRERGGYTTTASRPLARGGDRRRFREPTPFVHARSTNLVRSGQRRPAGDCRGYMAACISRDGPFCFSLSSARRSTLARHLGSSWHGPGFLDTMIGPTRPGRMVIHGRTSAEISA